MQFQTMNDVHAWRERQRRYRHLSWEAHQLCCTLCDKLYNWRPEDPARLERVLKKARARLARRDSACD